MAAKRRITDLIIIHCTATKEGINYDVATIDKWHKQRGFEKIGYNFLIYLDGTVHKGREIDEVGAHTTNYNSRSVGICYVGGLDKNGKAKDTRTPQQKAALTKLITELLIKYPNATVHGHKEYAAKACPCFDARNEYKHLEKK